MHMHKYEKIWLVFGGITLIVFLSVIGVSAFAMGHHPPSDMTTIDPEKVKETAPFDDPGLKKIGDNEYEAVMVAQAFMFGEPLEVPKGATVHFKVTSADVVHGFSIPGTNVNMMITPGHINTITHKFDEAGEFLIICNEYCGVGHQAMSGKIEVN
ncbi:cytochrome c oxidase subunit II [Sediminibacillus halophilus]|uniref:Cytochrome aa3 subunit 2 n=1 Tax=Sediminibacillus halophilus TaxID=482461 RepID=A0A1G9NW22_9BACI|nr:cytochrome c oxidase subunit II [Sediminibacillus halophilus]SDL90564.1 cytochrome c oxidase subunit 2 [Sediminibacillus halophilus]